GGIIVLAFGIIMAVVKNRLARNSRINSDGYRTMIKALQEGFGGIRYILLGRCQSSFVHEYEKGDRPFRTSAAHNSVIRQAPRFFIEAVGIVLVSILTVYLMRRSGGDVTEII